MPMVKMKSGKVMKFPYTKKGKAAAKKARMKKYGGGAKKSITSMRKAYGHGGEVMPKAKPC